MGWNFQESKEKIEKKIEEIVDRLKTIVRDMLTNEEDMETKSFDYEEGIVISGNDAQLIMSALSKAEDTHVSDIHVGNIPTNSLDELERDILSNYDMDDALLVSYIIAKIKELKTITT